LERIILKEFGQDLKFLRESKNITIAEISAETRINPKFFLNFEAGNFYFQPETYVRAFLKEYANSIGEDEAQLLFDYEKAKSGYYVRKYIVKEEEVGYEPEPVPEEFSSAVSESELKLSEQKDESPKENAKPKPSYETGSSSFRYSTDYDTLNVNRRKRLKQKILLGIAIFVIIAGVVILINYLNKTSAQKQSSEIKPKSFDEISEKYENKIKGKTEKEIADSIKNLTSVTKSDSLTLTVKAVKEVRIKVYLDENRLVEEVIRGGDSLLLKTKDQFRFSAANQSFDLFLDGKLLQKPKLQPGTTIKNLIIRKVGIIQP
jgi:cytoskeletal protein RodZ